MQFALTQSAQHYNPFTLVIADSSAAYVIAPHGPTLHAQKLPPGFYLLTNREPNDLACPRIARSLPRFLQVAQTCSAAPVSLAQLFTQLHPLLADHTTSSDARENLCLHLNGYGTCSSTLLAYSRGTQQYTYHFAPGPPCRVAYELVSVPPVTLASQPPSTT
jgi:hypothetical protein